MQHIIGSSIRHILLHYHIFKNAGSTLDSVLQRNFGPALAFLHTDDPNSVLTTSDVMNFLQGHASVRALSSHHLRPPAPANDAFVFLGMLPLRNPIDRLGSMYAYYRVLPGGDVLAAIAKQSGLRGFLDTLVNEYPQVSNNPQVAFLANSGRYTRPPDERDLEKAVEMLRREAVVITTDLFDRALVAAEYYLRPSFGPLDLTYTAQNVSPGRHKDLEMRLREIENACGPRLFETLMEFNRLDLELLDAAAMEIDRRFRLIPNSGQMLEGFIQRCAHRKALIDSQSVTAG